MQPLEAVSSAVGICQRQSSILLSIHQSELGSLAINQCKYEIERKMNGALGQCGSFGLWARNLLPIERDALSSEGFAYCWKPRWLSLADADALGTGKRPPRKHNSRQRQVAGSNPARGSNIKPSFPRFLPVCCPNGSDFDQLFFRCYDIS